MAFSRSGKSATGSVPSSLEGSCDPSLTFDLEDFLMNEALGSNEISTFVNIHAPIKEEPEAENEDSYHEYVHSPMGLPIPQRNYGEMRFSSTPSSLTEAASSSSPSLWGGAMRLGGGSNFPSTPFNTPIQGTFYPQTDLKAFFTPYSRNPTLPLTIKEEVVDLDTDLQTMKAVSMFPMEEDDIFQVDKADLIQGPTLAELNANDESLLSDMNFDDFLLPSSSRKMADSAESGLAMSQGDRFRMTELNAAFASSPSFSAFELAKTKNNSFAEEELSQLSSSHIGLEFDQSPSAEVGFPTSNPSTAMDTDITGLLSASLPASLSRVTRTSREEPKVKPPPPYPGSRKTVPELLPLQVQENTSSSHSPSPTRPPIASGTPHWGGARQRTVSNAGVLSPGTPHQQQQRQADCKSPSLAASNPLLLARLSSSAPAPSLLAGDPSLWQRREPRPRLLSTSSLVGEVHGGSTSSISTAGILSPGSFDFSHDEGFDSEEDSDHYEDFDDSDSDVGGSDDDSRDHRPGSSAGGSTSGKKERYFWQYNVQAKGPKGQKLNVTSATVDPHVLAEAQDPVFSPYCSVDGIKHSGKARRGDGNDLTPNPRKLHNIGRELDKLNRLINDMTPVSELPVAVRPKSRKEKNKLASRACRLKKKAQHEANKVKLFGLEQEHKKLMSVLHQVKLLLASKCESLLSSQSTAQQQQEVTQRIERVVKPVAKIKIAGHTAEFVNRVLERVKNGEPAGGLDEF